MKTLLIIAFVCIGFSAFSQDVIIILNNRDVIQATITKETPESVTYIDLSEKNGIPKTISRSDINVIQNSPTKKFEQEKKSDAENNISNDLLKKMIKQDSLMNEIFKKFMEQLTIINKQQAQYQSDLIDAIYKIKSNESPTDLKQSTNEIISNVKQLTADISSMQSIVKEVTDEKKSTIEPRVFGIGSQLLDLGFLMAHDLVSSPMKRILMPISFHKNFRMELDFAFANVSASDSAGSSIKYHSSAFEIGLGIFPMFQKGKANIYFGPRIIFGTSSSSVIYTDFPTLELKNVRYNISASPTLGAEFFPVGNHFSIGSEFSVYVNYSFGRSSYENGLLIKGNQDPYTTIGSQVRILTRLYF